MNRRVPEFALAAGLALGVPVGLYAAFFGQPLVGVLAFVVLAYPFAVYAVVVDDDPTNVLVPDYVLGALAVVAGGAVLFGVAGGAPAFGLFVGLVAVLPAVAYHARYGASVNPLAPRWTALVVAWVALGVAVAGLPLGDPPSAAASAALLVVAAADYWQVRARRPSRRVERYAAFACLGAAALAVVGFVVAGEGLAGTVLGAGLVVAAVRIAG